MNTIPDQVAARGRRKARGFRREATELRREVADSTLVNLAQERIIQNPRILDKSVCSLLADCDAAMTDAASVLWTGHRDLALRLNRHALRCRLAQQAIGT